VVVEVQVSVEVLDAYKQGRLADATMPQETKSLIVHRIGKRTLELAQQWVPVDKGNLKNSVLYEEDEAGFGIEYTALYARYVHEIMTNYHMGNTRAKWLTDAFNQAMGELLMSYGATNIPTFYLSLELTTTLKLTASISGGGASWRDYV